MRTWWLAAAFFSEAVRTKLILLGACFTALVMMLSFLIAPLSLGTVDKITRDMGVSSLILSASILVFTGGIHLLSRERERKSIYLILTRPISRGTYLFGKYLGLLLTAWAVLLISAIIFALTLLARGAAPDVGLVQTMLLSACELIVLSAVAVFFSTIVSPVPAMLYALGVFIAGHGARDLSNLSGMLEAGPTRALFDVLRHVLPDLSRFDARLEAVHGLAIPGSDVAWALGYAALYGAAILLFTWVVFERKEFA